MLQSAGPLIRGLHYSKQLKQQQQLLLLAFVVVVQCQLRAQVRKAEAKGVRVSFPLLFNCIEPQFSHQQKKDNMSASQGCNDIMHSHIWYITIIQCVILKNASCSHFYHLEVVSSVFITEKEHIHMPSRHSFTGLKMPGKMLSSSRI